MKLTITRDYCKCGLHCKKYGMNRLYCRKQFERSPTRPKITLVFPPLIKTAPDRIGVLVKEARELMKEYGKLSSVILMRKLKVTQKQAAEIMQYV